MMKDLIADHRLMDGKAVAARILESCRAVCDAHHNIPELVSISISDMPEVVMIGHSEIVEKSAVMMLMAEGAAVTECHHMARSVSLHSRRAAGELEV
ncbi:hypothetical protein MUY35_00135 [Aliiroseovarius sp. S1339]|uniref:hypothetical protein n=1 Tax=Aliiroseovarius sp. S1339 TaxID=2936990 RepID=UPI0020BF0895|nr:hypothetical protein [Aliiroseovarius sp. S1339]MCK8462253.1 hypothetical protein [Aliiroseovarius sp. S1339]